ncbi:hypothetical protein DFH07DRAFT_879163 [Mycena maculata]|uniref:BTB domain-containing protein n=1 Tax=Mycena maculata TaxID=230809 RepID=A0AAD7NRE4_9AGAR|nr:hypothetical protein DFH07DRAFT_879163 [Mycena maculata]
MSFQRPIKNLDGLHDPSFLLPTMASPPAKRPRTENVLITCSDIWYRDGSVVLQAGDTQFRVHWTVLEQNSPFFRAMQGLPQPPDQPTVEGCPVVELPDDAEDVRYLLKALYSPTFLMQKTLPFPAVAALIRLGRKYDFREILDATVERVTFENPTTLEEFPSGKYNPTRIDYHPGLVFDMITLIRENNILSALPCAYYRAILFHSVNIIDGIPREDGTLAALASIDQRRCGLAREKLIKTQLKTGYTIGWLRDQGRADCTNTSSCDAKRTEILYHYLDILNLWALGRIAQATMGKSLCEACRKHAIESNESGRKKLWEELPSFFELPPWNELKNDL